MSRTMHIDVRLLPVYDRLPFDKLYPGCAALLRDVGKKSLLEKTPTLYHLVDELVRTARDPNVSGLWKKVLQKHVPELVRCRDQAREALLARELRELDQMLYRLEDLFDDLDKDLRWEVPSGKA
ncbi:hypothetical protein [Desulfosoma caldarium]|uniref:Uncharacterized protein n=1 Tax=Desulfosoma caldarium TaxID=610254 RepID=A0A3N1UQ98_9BACT|nr:hypothetical protein [Desulfosoma caldarium]ROQ90707.1 hypothetical protein EDC27_2597 [Desulfosoma caldarium]